MLTLESQEIHFNTGFIMFPRISSFRRHLLMRYRIILPDNVFWVYNYTRLRVEIRIVVWEPVPGKIWSETLSCEQINPEIYYLIWIMESNQQREKLSSILCYIVYWFDYWQTVPNKVVYSVGTDMLFKPTSRILMYVFVRMIFLIHFIVINRIVILLIIGIHFGWDYSLTIWIMVLC